MARKSDLYYEMRRFLLDDQTADRMLSGHMAPEDAPPGFSRAVQVLRATQGPASSTELARGASTVAQAVAAVQASVPSLSHPGHTAQISRRSTMLTKLLTAKVAAIAVATVLGATAAAAATGALPTTAQNAMSSALSSVGISIPRGSQSQAPGTTSQATSHRGTHGTQQSTTRSTGAKGPVVTGAAKYGLCTAYAARSSNPSSSKGTSSVAFANLEAAAKAAGESVSKFCAGATPPSSGPPATNPGQSHVPSNPGPPATNPGQSHVPSNPGSPANTSTNPGQSHVPSNH